MKKFKTRKEILENPEFKRLALEFMLEYTAKDDHEVETQLSFFIDRKMKQCILEGV
jgi:hypothetical protein